MRKVLSVLALLVGMGIAAGQAPGAVNGLYFIVDDDGTAHPILTSDDQQPPYTILGEGKVDSKLYPKGSITSKELSVQITSEIAQGGRPTFTYFTTAKVTNGRTFQIKSPSGGIPSDLVTVLVTGKFRPAPNQPERDVRLEASGKVKFK